MIKINIIFFGKAHNLIVINNKIDIRNVRLVVMHYSYYSVRLFIIKLTEKFTAIYTVKFK